MIRVQKRRYLSKNGIGEIEMISISSVAREVVKVLDFKLINIFRDKVNEEEYVFFKYRNVNGEDQWSRICSAMDWITVGMEYIQSVKEGGRSTQQSMEMYAYISSIDVVWEAIRQLHYVFFQTLDTPFWGEQECFSDKVFQSSDDNHYFKEIRAAFGAHPVDLKVKNGGKKEKFFASWSGSFLGGYDVLLYNGKVGGGYLKMSLDPKELDLFLEKRYSHLKKLIDEIDRQYINFKNEMIKKAIPKNQDVVSQLETLKDEAEKRNFSGINGCIQKLIIIFSTKITNQENERMVLSYRELLDSLVQDIYFSLQNMDFEELDDSLLYERTNKLSNGYGYYIEKLMEYINSAGYSPIIWEGTLREIFDSHFILEYENFEEFYVLIRACINQLNSTRV